MTRSIDKIQNILLTVIRLEFHLDSMTFNGNAPLLFKIHVVKNLCRVHLGTVKSMGYLKKSVGKG